MDGGRKIWRPVYFASRSLSETERRYAQIEKEALALKWAVTEKFKLYLLGLPEFILQTDHRPLVTILGKKALCDLTPRLQNFKLKLMEYRYTIVHVAGKDMRLADTLSRTPLPQPQTKEEPPDAAVDLIECETTMDPAWQEVAKAQQEDHTTGKVKKFVEEG